MVATIILIPGMALTIERWLNERNEIREKAYNEMMAKEDTINKFTSTFKIERTRAEILYRHGFKDLEDFRGKSVAELMVIDDINPTLAKNIVSTMENL
jgi:replicative superfamily II helicase